MLRKIGFLCLAFGCVSGCVRDEPPSEITYARPLSPYHTVKEGETVSSIAQQYNMNEEDLVKINRLRSSSNLIRGQRILVHVKSSNLPSEFSPAVLDDVKVKEIGSPKEDTTGKDSKREGDNTAAAPELPTTPEKSTLPSNDIKSVASLEKQAPNGGKVKNYDWPVDGEIIQRFGQKMGDGNVSEGVNIRAPANLPVKSIGQGVVKNAGNTIAGYGNMVVIKHPDNYVSVYAHLSETLVKTNDVVTRGQVIGRVGDTGMVKGNPQLYLHVRNAKSKPVNPLSLFP